MRLRRDNAQRRGSGGKSLVWQRPLLATLILVLIKVICLLSQQALGVVGKILAGLDRFFARLVEGGFPGQRVDDAHPLRRGFVQFLERGADVGLAIGVLFQVLIELIHQGGHVLQFVIELVGAGGRAGAEAQGLDRLGVLVHVLGVEIDPIVGIDSRFADRLDLGLGERLALFFLGRQEGSRAQAENGDEEPAQGMHGMQTPNPIEPHHGRR